jgi:hypothetical protein
MRIEEAVARLLKLASPAELIRQSDPDAIAWIYMSGRLLTGKGMRHIDIVMREKDKLLPAEVAGLAKSPLGRSSSDLKSMGLWFTSAEARSSPYADAIMATKSERLANDDTMLLFTDGKQEPLGEFLGEKARIASWLMGTCRFRMA